MFDYTWRYSDNLRSLYETPALAEDAGAAIDAARAADIIRSALGDGRTLLDEYESKALLAAYGIPVTETAVARTEAEAVAAADRFGYPVVVKLYSHTITHKTDVGGVQLDLADAEAVAGAYRSIEHSVRELRGAEHFEGVTVQPMVRATGYELILGSSVDPQFGPVLLFGTGGQLVEVFRDRALGLPPLNTTLARRMVERTRIHEALLGVRGRQPVDLAALDRMLVRFSQLVVEQRRISEIDINPLLVSPEGMIALDARVVLHDASVPDDALPRSAIRPYPRRYVGGWRARNGAELLIRPIRPEDEPLMVRFHESLSDETVYARYFEHLRLTTRVAHERLTRICFIDYDREIALVAEHRDAAGVEPSIVGIGRLSKEHGFPEAEFSLVIADHWQRQGLGAELLGRLVAIARDEGLERVSAEILSANVAMQRVARRVGFTLAGDPEHPTVRAELAL
jgi:acetyltransferase